MCSWEVKRWLLTFLEDRGAVDLENAGVVFVLFVERHCGISKEEARIRRPGGVS